MQDVIEFLREESKKCLEISKIAGPEMVKSWLQSAELFERAADFIELRCEVEPNRTEKRNRTGTRRREEPV